ncbi:DUF4347 domain-containing protein [Pseudomonas sp. Marseille-P9899]|uniref:DUF4347 domain-containing protein n=1 Tax=Pseudomonas sp. Marseille-P9899 TaxID=2730401 RepID=UPI001C49C91E|nr:DUF4347 domain-containing protein [Pseudomonas sp. Marseille-P9899]
MKFIERFSRQPGKQGQPVDPGAAPLLMALEPRIMFDASVGVVAQDAAQATSEPTADSTSKDTASAAASADTRSTQGTQGSQASQRQEVVFVDGQIGNVQQLLTGLSSNAEIVVLDPTKDGLQQMADYLQGREGLDAVHLLSHGADGTVQVGNVWLASSNLSEHRAALESIGSALKADGDLMIYGCRVGDSSTGQTFIDQLAAITGADVAASADDTGSALLGGNWTLERSSGAIETTALVVNGYEGVLVASWSTGSSPLGSTIGASGRTVVGDFDGDGDTDILYQTAGNGSAWSYARSNGNGTFTTVAQAQSPFAGVTLLDHSGTNYYVGDFDGDGDVDILIGVNGTTGNFLRNDSGSFVLASSASFPAPGAGTRMVVGDFDNDGDTDILYQTAGNGTAWAYARSDGGGSFTLLTLASSPFAGLTLPDNSGNNYFVADFDGDGDLDVLAAVSGATGTYLRNNGNGTFSSQPTATFPAPAANGRMLVGDFDGDGSADILYQTGANGTAFQFAKSNGDGTFTIMSLASSPLAGLSLIDHTGTNYRVGDFDGDGDLDIFSAASSTSGNLYLQNGAAPELVSTSPSDNATGVSTTANITLTFSESVTKGSTGSISIIRTSDNTVVETIPISSGQISGSGTTWTIDPSIVLAGGVSYAVRVDPKTFVDADGTVFKGINNLTTLNFTTVVALPPVIANLNGDAVTYVEDSAYVLLDGSSNATVSDADSSNFNGGKLTAQITTGRVNGEDVLFIRNQGAGANQIAISSAQITYNGLVIGTFTGGSNGDPLVITFTANANATTVAALVQNLAYRNSNTVEPSTASRSVSISMDDGAGGSSAVSVVALTVQSVNDTPVVNATATNPTYTENTSAVQLFNGATVNTVESGQKITEMTFTVSTVFNGAAEKLVIDGSDVTLVNGTSVVTTNNGTVVTVSVTSGTASVTLTSSSGLDSATAQTILNTMAYRNDSESPNVSNRVVTLNSVTDNGGSANGGLPTASIGIFSTVAVVGVNDAPVLAGAPYSLTSINEDTTSAGVRISTLLTNYTMVDADTGALRGIAVYGKSGNGTWQYSTDNVNWTDFGAVSSSSALLLASTTYIHYVPNGANGETASLNFRGWDQTSGTASVNGVPGVYDTTSNGGTTAFSTATAVVNQIVTSLNDAPVLTSVSPILPDLSDGQTNNPGVLVSSLYSTNYTDVDTVAVKGIAITGLNRGNGNWQFSTDGGTSWSTIGSVTVNSALLLRSNDRVRFVPDGLNGTTADFTFRAWDQTGITIGLQGVKYDTSVAGGTTPFSIGQDTASITVTAANDAPTLTGSGGNLTWTEGNNTTSIPVVIDNAVTISDADGPYIASATVHILYNYSNGNDYLELVSNPATMGNIIGTWDAVNGTLTLTSAGNQASLAQFQAALRAVTFTNLSDSPTPLTRTVQFQVNDGSLDSAVVTRDIIITGVDDAPVISAPASTQVVEDVASVINQISISDPDSVNIYMTLNVTSGTLSATSGDGVVVGGNATTMNLSGTIAAVNAFIANNRLTYTTAANATADATLTVLVDTGSVGTDTKTITLSVVPVNDAPVVTVPVSIAVTEDLAASVTGISFSDIDAGSASVTATFSVTGGTLTALSGNGVTVTDSGTATLTLSGSLSDINAFIAAASVKYQTALNSTASELLSVTINDNGNTGGTAQTDTKMVIINVIPVNDAPVNAVPGDQTVKQDAVLTFNTANGNLISISDVDADGSPLIVTVTATNGLITLATTTGLAFHNGNVPGTATLEFEGSLAQINAALNGMKFTPTPGYNGPASFTIISNDQGATGSGGVLTDTDTFNITVQPLNPGVTNVSILEGNRAYKVGETVNVAITFDMNVTVAGGVPTLLLETGAIDRFATYVSGSGTNSLIFSYTVQAGDVSADLDYHSTGALQLNGATLKSAASDDAVLTLPTLGGANSIAGQKAIVIDGVVPTISSVNVPSDGTYIVGQNLDFTVNFSENVIVSTVGGTPRIEVTLDTGGTVYADYVSGSGGSALVFRLAVASGQLDSNGISLGSSVQPNGGSIRDGAGNDAVVALNGVAGTGNVNVDGVAPTVVSVTTPPDGNYKAGAVLTFTVNASEALQTGGLPPRLVLDVGGVTRYATYVSGSGSDALVFQYTVLAGHNDGDGIAVNGIDLRGEPLTDLAGNNLNLTLNNVGSTVGVVVDTTAPLVSSIVQVDPVQNNQASVSFNVTFSEKVTVLDPAAFAVFFNGTTRLDAVITTLDGLTYNVKVNDLMGAGTVGLMVAGNNIVDAAGNPYGGSVGPISYTIDRVAPSVTSVDVPASGSYVAGQNLDFTVQLDEAVLLNTSNGSPRLEVTLDNGEKAYATYLSGAGTNALVFRLTVANGQLDTNGIEVGSSIQLNGATLRDALGNDANTTLNGLGNTTGVLVDAVAPVVDSVGLPADGSYKAGDVLSFTVNTSEGVVVDTSDGTPRLVLTVGGVTRYASYVSGAAGGALVFQYTVQAGDTAAGGLVVGNTLDLNGGTVRDPAGNALNLDLNGLGNAGNVLIDTTAPTANGLVRVDVSPNNSGSVSYTLTFSENVSGVDVADFNLFFTGSASGSIASVTQVDGRTYTVLVDAIGGTGSLRLDLKASGTGIADAAGNAVVGGLTGASYSIDRVAPSVVSVDAPAAGTYVAGQNLDFTVHLDETVQLDLSNGTPRIEVLLDNGTTAYATYLSGAGSNALVFRLTVASGQLDTNGVTLGSAIQLNGGILRDSVGNNANVALNGVEDTSQVRVDAVVPTVSTVGLPAPGAYNAGDVLRFTVNISENVIVDTSASAPRLALTLGGQTRYANYVSGSGSNALVFEYVIEPSNNATAIGLPGNLDLNGSTVRDAAGNAMNLALNAPNVASGVVVDTVAPSVSNIANVDFTPTNAGSVRYTVTFNESVSGVDSADFSLFFTGTASGRIASVEQVNGRTYTIVVDNLAGAGNVRLDLNSTGTGITDVAGNLITGGLQGSLYSIDRVAPSVNSVDVPASGTYVAGQQLDFTVRTSEAVLVDSGNGNPRLAITLDGGRVVYADYVSTTGGNALLFRLSVTSGMSGNSTFNVGSAIDLNGGTIRDAQGNDAQTGLNNVADTRGILLDAKAPRPSSIVVDGPVQPTDRTLNFTLTFDEAVSGVDAGDFSVVGTGNASGSVQSVQQIDAKTYRITVGNMSGAGALALSLNALNSGIRDQAGNDLAVSLIGQSQTIQSQDVGDLNYRLNPPEAANAPSTVVLQPQVPGFVVTDAVSPLIAPGLFEVRTVGGNVQPLGVIFLGNGSSAPSFIAQVFGSSDGGAGGNPGGFLGFGGGEGGVFGSSTFAGIFGRDVPGVSEMNVFNGNQWKQSDLNQGLRGVFGAPTLGQQLHHINEADQRHVRELAMALAQPAQIGKRA